MTDFNSGYIKKAMAYVKQIRIILQARRVDRLRLRLEHEENILREMLRM